MCLPVSVDAPARKEVSVAVEQGNNSASASKLSLAVFPCFTPGFIFEGINCLANAMAPSAGAKELITLYQDGWELRISDTLPDGELSEVRRSFGIDVVSVVCLGPALASSLCYQPQGPISSAPWPGLVCGAAAARKLRIVSGLAQFCSILKKVARGGAGSAVPAPPDRCDNARVLLVEAQKRHLESSAFAVFG